MENINKYFLQPLRDWRIWLTAFCCYETLRPLRIPSNGVVSNSVWILFHVLCILSVIKRKKITESLNTFFDSKLKKIFMILLEIYGTVAMIGPYISYSEYATYVYAKRINIVVYFIMALCWVCPIVRGLMAVLLRCGDSIEICKKETSFRSRLFLIIIMIIPCIPFLIAFNPAITSTDSRYCFRLAHEMWEPGFSMPNHHPPFYILLMSALLKIYDSVSFLIVMQYVCFAIVFVDGILFLYKCGLSKKLLGIFYLFCTFSVNNLIMLTTLWKDVPYTISLMWMTILLMKYVIRHEEYVSKISWYIQFVVAVIFVAFIRQNGILPAITIIILFPICTRFSARSVITSITCLAMIFIVKGPIYDALNVIPAPGQKYDAWANDIMLSYYTGHETSADVVEMVNLVTENNPEEFLYNPYYVRVLSHDNLGEYSFPEFFKIYVENTFKHPILMIKAVMLRSSAAWSIVRPRDEPATCVNHLGYLSYEPGTYPDKYLYPNRVENELTQILTNICNAIKKNTILYLFLWRAGIYNLVILYTAVLTFVGNKDRKILYALPFVPILINVASLIIASGWSDYRLFWSSVPVSLLLVLYFLYNRKCIHNLL